MVYDPKNLMTGTLPISFNIYRGYTYVLQPFRGLAAPRGVTSFIRVDESNQSQIGYQTFVQDNNRTDLGGAYFGIFIGK